MNICCDCKIEEGLSSERTIWYVPEPKSQKKKHQDYSLSSIRSLKRSQIISNKSHITLPKVKINLSHFRTRTSSQCNLSLPSKVEDQSTIDIQNFRQLQRQNYQYDQIIKTQLLPLKKDYQVLFQKYQQKELLVNLMSNRLVQIQSQYFTQKNNYPSKSTAQLKSYACSNTNKQKILKKQNDCYF